MAVHAHTNVHTHIHTHAHAHTHAPAHTHTHTHTRTCACTHTRMRAYTPAPAPTPAHNHTPHIHTPVRQQLALRRQHPRLLQPGRPASLFVLQQQRQKLPAQQPVQPRFLPPEQHTSLCLYVCMLNSPCSLNSHRPSSTHAFVFVCVHVTHAVQTRVAPPRKHVLVFVWLHIICCILYIWG